MGYFIDGRDGQEYRTVKIGGLVWMARNLNYKIDGSWCYDNNEANGTRYGRLYTWDMANSTCHNAICHIEWRLPTRQEWHELIETVGVSSVAGKKLKATREWKYNGNGTDEYEFSALPGGGYNGISFDGAGCYGFWWTATKGYGSNANFMTMGYDYGDVRENDTIKSCGFSVRCVMK